MPAVIERNVRTSNVESDCSADDIEAAWDAEVDRRLQEVLDGTAVLIPVRGSWSKMREWDRLDAADSGERMAEWGRRIEARGSRRWMNTVRPSGLGWGDGDKKAALFF